MSIKEVDLWQQTLIGQDPESNEKGDGTLANTGEYIAQTRNEVATTIDLSRIGKNCELPVMGGLTILRELGKGGMGTVFLAKQSDGKLFAVKIIDAQDNNAEVRAKREFETVKRAYADGIDCVPEPHAYEILTNGTEQRHCIVTEFIPGRDVASLIQEKGPLSIHEAFWFATKASNHLLKIHKAGVIHRDIKPANIMIGGNKDVTIMDFGLVRDINERTVTGNGVFVGTLPYLAPEVFINGGKSNSAPCDVYALGISFYEALVGKKPLEYLDPLEYFAFWQSDALKLIIKKEHCPRATNRQEQEYIDAFFNLILEMTHPNPEKRLNMEEVCAALSTIGTLPDTNASKIALPSLHFETERHTVDTVRECMTDAAITIKWGKVPDGLPGFNVKRTAEFTRISPKSIQTHSQKQRIRMTQVLGLTTLSIGGLVAYMHNNQPSENQANASPTPVATTPNLIEVPKPSHIHIERNTDGSVSEINFHVDTSEFKTTILLNPSEATIVEIQYDDHLINQNPITQVHSERNEPQFGLGFMCDADVGVAVSKMIYEGSNQEPLPGATEKKFLFVYTMKNGNCIFYFPSLGIIFQEGDRLTRYTLQNINDGLHGLDPNKMAILQSIRVQISENTEPLQSIPTEVVTRHKYAPTYAAKFKLRPKSYLETLIESGKNPITPASATTTQ